MIAPACRQRCQHCGRCFPKLRRRGLCTGCYYIGAIRALYGPASRFSPTFEDFNGGYGLPDQPTDAPPGSAEKIEVMRLRFLARQGLWHPGDAGYR